MDELIAVSFHDSYRAAEAFNLLWQMNDDLVIELDDAVLVHRDRFGNLEYDQEFASTLKRGIIRAELRRGLVGALVAALLAVGAYAIIGPTSFFACAVTGGLIGLALGASRRAEDEAWWKDHACALNGLVPEVIDGIGPGDSAVVAWVDSGGLEVAAPAFRGFGGKVLHTTLPPIEKAMLESVLRG